MLELCLRCVGVAGADASVVLALLVAICWVFVMMAKHWLDFFANVLADYCYCCVASSLVVERWLTNHQQTRTPDAK